MLERLKNISRNKLIDKILKDRGVAEQNSRLKYLGFIVDEDFFTDFDSLYEFGQNLGLLQKDIKIFTFVETSKNLATLGENQITNKEFNWRGEIIQQSAVDFLDFSFDVLIGLYEKEQFFLDLMVAKSKAKFKIGCNAKDLRLYDLILHIDIKNIELFKSEVIKYLKIFKKI